MFRKAMSLLLLSVVCVVFGCSANVPAGKLGRVKTSSGWSQEILKPGYHTCFGYDQMYLIDATHLTGVEKMNILVGGKVNLTVDLSTRCKVNTTENEALKAAFESVAATKNADGMLEISSKSLYDTFLKMKVLAIPRAVYEIQPDVQTAVANSPKLATEVRKLIMEAAKGTPLTVEDFQITNYDWPPSVTKAQEDLVGIQLKEAAAEAQVKADLKKAEGDLKVKEAEKLVQLKEAEAVAESIDIIKKKLADAPEYLMWHQIKVMGQAAMGPNNCFILYPYNTDANQVKGMLNNTNLTQMLKPEGPHPEMKKNPPLAEKIKD
jgi:regulator of protease activity HflC (stomatin/prohibitin superfamily)